MGAKVILAGRDQPRLDDTLASMFGEGHEMRIADLTHMAARNALIDSLPAIDGCAFCAGAAELVPVRMVSERHFAAMMGINFTAPVMLTQRMLYLKKLRNQASLVYVTAITDRSSPVASAMYSSAKGALTAFSRTVALEHAKQGIRSNCVLPGYVDTPMLTKLKNTVLAVEKLNLTPLGSVAASDVANAMVYLLSPASRWVTRSALVIDGGLSLPMH